MSSNALVLLQVFYEDSSPFNVHAASCQMVESFIRSRFIGKEGALLVLNCPFRDLSDRATVRLLRNHRQTLHTFSRKIHSNSGALDLVVLINTHANPDDGALLYGRDKGIGLQPMLEHICGDLSLSDYHKTVFFLLCCGGFVRHSLPDFRAASTKFSSAFAFGARMLDSYVTCMRFATTILDFHLLGRESLWKAFSRTATAEMIHHTSAYLGLSGCVYRMRRATWRSHPNGDAVRCCSQPAKYCGTRPDGRIKFRCQCGLFSETSVRSMTATWWMAEETRMSTGMHSQPHHAAAV
ncbi:hypothetical protein BV20DRAFT_1038983 [Pilatotrama ljubarskyi]|nr:hypothetical protein BV20DRAFT_1038983 [Pilatotrama ljubarskyi]